MFKDEAQITVQSGDGGNGCVSFLREKFMEKGGPDGGDGGRGGDVIIRAAHNCSTLLDLIRKRSYVASNGKQGQGKNKSGRSASNVIIRVPMGTIIRNEDGEIVADLKENEEEVVVAKGGYGGRGNSHFATSTHQTPRDAEDGAPGEEHKLFLELKLIADVGLVGFPNAGKSTFLSRVSAARPKIGSYPFTTLQPNLGIVDLGDEFRLIIADIPGILEGAHKGVGLGDKFLRHIERTRILLYMVDMTPEQGKSPLETWQILQNELESYSPILAKKTFLIAANKMDITGTDEVLEEFQKEFSGQIHSISGVSGKGVPKLLQSLAQALKEIEED